MATCTGTATFILAREVSEWSQANKPGNEPWTNNQVYLVDSEIRVGRNDCATAEVDSLAAQVASESALLAFKTLSESAREFLGLEMREPR